MTRTQRKILDAIRHHWLEHGVSPTYSELAKATGRRSRSGIHRLVSGLAEQGMVERGTNRRSIRLTSPALSLQLPPDLDRQVRALAARANVTPEVVVVEAVRDALKAVLSSQVRSLFVTCETISPADRRAGGHEAQDSRRPGPAAGQGAATACIEGAH